MNHIRLTVCCVCVLLLAACGGGGGSSAPPQVATVTVTPPAAYVTPGQQVQLTATVTDGAGTTVTAPVTWVSGNAAVATVNSAGLVMATTSGVVSITATSEGQSAVAYISILQDVFLVATVSAGNNHTCALIANGGLPGTACCWGDNSSGQLGDGTGINQSAPVCLTSSTKVEGLPFYSSISAGGDHTCAIQQAGGAAFCWGDNSSGELGNGTTTTSTIPVPVSGGLSFVAVSAGAHHTCGVTSEGALYCWGDNTFGQLGNGTTTNSTVPVPVTVVITGGGWNQISAGSRNTCANFDTNAAPIIDGFAYCWGDNSAGQFGNGTTTGSNIPVPVGEAPYGTLAGVGTLYICVTATSNNTACSGNNTYGQLGNGTTTSSLVPVTVTFPTGINAISGVSAGSDHACAVVAGVPQPVYCWGNNSSGKLGNGTVTNSATPIAVAGGLNFAVVSAGGQHTCGVTSSNPQGPTAGGGVYCWGDNTYGQLGNLSTTSSSVPVNVAGPQ